MPVVAPMAIGGLFWILGYPTRAIVLWVIAAVTAVLVVVGVPVDRYLARFAAAVAHGVGLVASLFVGVLLLVAGGVVRLFRRDPLTPRAQRGNGWLPAPSAIESDRLATATFGVERPGSGHVADGGLRTLGRGIVLAVGSVAVLLLVDLGVGLGWEKVSADDSPLAGVADRVNFTGNTDTVADIRAELPAMAAYPWADEYLREIQTTPNSYWPFTESRPVSFQGKYVTIEGWARRSYIPDDLPEDAPVVWMFGGSTTWGEGQRDEYTIASYLARLAESEGTPIRVVNYGQRGWTHFQEMILFEQLLAEGPPPDIALFYDGANEINAQTLGAKGVPTHTLVDQYAEKISDGIADEFASAGEAQQPPSNARLAWEAYLSHSALQKAVRAARDAFDPPAGASESVATQDDGADDGKTGRGQNYVKTVQDAVRAIDVYERGRAMTTFLADDYGVEPVFFWQPVMAGDAEIWANDNISDPTINISDSLEAREDVFIDGGHTNEEGARLVAERIWVDLRPLVDDLDRD